MKLLSKIMVFGAMCSLMLSSCDEARVFEEHTDLKLFRWNLSDTISYDVKIEDKEEKNVLLGIRHHFRFEYRNVIAKLFITSPDGTIIETPVNMLLAEPNGMWYSDCAGDICDMLYQIPEFEGYSFPDTGTYRFDIVHDMRQDPLLNTMSVGLRIENVIAE